MISPPSIWQPPVGLTGTMPSADGLAAAQIAERLSLSVHTVNTHRQRIYGKMSVKNVTDMIRKATELGII